MTRWRRVSPVSLFSLKRQGKQWLKINGSGGGLRHVGMQLDMHVVAAAENGRQNVDFWRKLKPDVTLLDVRMPGLDGVGVIEEIRRDDASAKFIILTTYDTDNEINRTIKAGAKGYLLKGARREELLECIRKVSAGGTCIPPALVEKLAATIRSD